MIKPETYVELHDKFDDFNVKNEPRNAKIAWLIKWPILRIFN